MPGPTDTDRGELQPDPREPSGDAARYRDEADTLEEHSTESTSPTDADAARPDPDVS